MRTVKGFAHTTIIFYIIAIAVCASAVYYLNTVYNTPQPYVYVSYNTLAQGGIGYVNNTLSFPIEVTSIYCTIPSGIKEIFGNPNNNILVPGSNTQIMIGINNELVKLPANCTNWKVDYDRLPANATPPNSLIEINPPSNSKSSTNSSNSTK